MLEETNVELPNSTQEGSVTAQVTDYVTIAEFRNIVQNGKFDAETLKQLQYYLDNLEAMPEDKDRIDNINQAIALLRKNPTNKAEYKRLLALIRGMVLPVQLPDGTEVKVAVSNWWNVGQVKALLSQKFGGQAAAYKLFAGGRELQNERSLDAELVRGQTLLMRRADSYELFVKGPSSERPVPISPDADVRELRAEANRINGMPEGGRLMCNGSQLQDGRSLRSYGIKAHSRVALTPRLTGG